ncbi:XdhC family protein [Deinococcus ruber]|uniref:YHS domain-containing protein n=1 Tax=Deinococcus ruber TaxID=1848197 RepID=A0A918FB01_9DEIO|nr:XdhC family protein [Deinococcus ruber]GGR26408.1 hypothetical protein GCM10008957_42450 [Deinococcus ruber]
MQMQFLEQLTRLQRSGTSFVTATVVSRRAPVSSHLGDRSIVYADGRMEGFVGGSCSRDIVRRQALEALKTGHPRLVLIRPDPGAGFVQADLLHAESAESVVIPMTCASEGAVDIYLEPYVPAPLLLVAGLTPVADAVARQAALMEYDVVRIVTAAEQSDLPSTARSVALRELPDFLAPLSDSRQGRISAVVASQGHYDEPVLEALLGAGVSFVGLLASHRRAQTVRELLELQGLSAEQTASIRSPVGLDLGARTPPEVAVSILAEVIVATRQPLTSTFSTAQVGAAAASARRPDLAEVPTPSVSDAQIAGDGGYPAEGRRPRPGFAFSPVDGEEIEMASAVHFAELNGTTYYFTCANCKRRFLKNPQQFLGQPQEQTP